MLLWEETGLTEKTPLRTRLQPGAFSRDAVGTLIYSTSIVLIMVRPQRHPGYITQQSRSVGKECVGQPRCVPERHFQAYIFLMACSDLALKGPKAIYEAVMAAWAGF